LTDNDARALQPPGVGDDRNDIADAFGRLLADLVASAPVAGAAALIWMEIEGALSPVFGRRGVAALYQRTLQSNTTEYRWLADIPLDSTFCIDFDILKTTLENQHATEAALAADLALRSFCELLTSLVGSSLTERLLRPVLNHFRTDAPVQGRPT